MTTDPHAPSQEKAANRSLRIGACLLIAIFWVVHFLMLSFRASVKNLGDPFTLGVRRAALASFGALMCYGIYYVLTRLRDRPFSHQAIVAALLSAAAAAAHAALNTLAFYDISPAPEILTDLSHFLYTSTYWYWFYFSWTTAFLALSYSFTVREQQRRASALQSEAHSAHMRALRYQINPHFLFNTLNSIAALIEEDKEQAERMVLNLSDFFRSSLAVDPLDDVRLADEIGIQKLYLEIERVRFPNRLNFEVDLPSDLEGAKVPSLLLQPLVENAVKHGVARSEGATTIKIKARQIRSRLCLSVTDDAEANEIPAICNGTGVGLSNVRNRLAARYGDEYAFDVSKPDRGGFENRIEVPLRF
ncbi:MAG TPA: histidine kinase [Allosphingosinicella sp.]|uniref:sensor histidine kinase n=1 Tax=Allosphingosinicella sp. TaxID=2823234 RepID=UPI002EDB4B41